MASSSSSSSEFYELSKSGNTIELVDSSGNVVSSIIDSDNQAVSLDTQQYSISIASGVVSSNGSGVNMLNSSSQRLSQGIYRITLSPPINNYTLQLTTASDEPNRDQRKISYRNVSSSSFDVITTVDDNGGTADPYSDIEFHFNVFSSVNLVTNVTIS